MFVSTLLSVVVQVVLVTAAKSSSFVDKFDNGNGLVPAASPIRGTAGGALYYNALEYFNLQLQSNVAPASTPNVATTGTAGQVTAGQPAWYPMNNTIKSFDQKSISYGCVTQTQEVGVAVSCSIQVTGVRAKDGITVLQILPYNPALLGANRLNFTTFPATTFSGLSRVAIQVIQGAVPPNIISPVFDNNAYVANY